MLMPQVFFFLKIDFDYNECVWIRLLNNGLLSDLSDDDDGQTRFFLRSCYIFVALNVVLDFRPDYILTN